MLEIPESVTLARQLEQTVVGKTIKSVIAAQSPHGFAFYFGDPQEYAPLLCGRKVGYAVARAGQVELDTDGVKLVFGDGVNMRYLMPDEPRPKKHQLLLEFNDQSVLVCTIQMYGTMLAFRNGENQNPYYLVTMEKPSPLTDQFDKAYFDQLVESTKPTLSIKAVLATEQRIPGLGNGVLQDILFCAGVNPKTKLDKLDSTALDRLFVSIRGTLAEMSQKGGRDTEKDLFGKYGGYQTILSKKTLKDPCPVCGGTLVRQAYLGGNVYYCPTCQPVIQ